MAGAMTTFVIVHGSFHSGWCWAKADPRNSARFDPLVDGCFNTTEPRSTPATETRTVNGVTDAP